MPAPALAQFAEPPENEVVVPIAGDGSEPWEPDWRTTPDSMVRVHVGPALDVVHGLPGFHAALDVGRSAGFRAATSFVAVGSAGGSAIYSGELWLCPITLGILRPIAAAGAGYRNASHRAEGDRIDHEHSGVAVLRGGFELLLPTRDVESRAALALAGYLPAIGSDSSSPDPSALLTASLAIGF